MFVGIALCIGPQGSVVFSGGVLVCGAVCVYMWKSVWVCVCVSV